MKSAIGFLITVFLSAVIHASTLDFTGTTSAERRIRFLWQNISPILISCYADDSNCLAPEHTSLIKKLIQIAPDRFSPTEFDSWNSKIKFVSEKDFTFESGTNEVHRIAITNINGERIIYFNTDQISKNGTPYTYDFYVGIIVHELMHWLDIPDDEKRLPDVIGSAVTGHFKAKSISMEQPLIHVDTPISLLVFNAAGPMNYPVIGIEEGQILRFQDFTSSDYIQPCAPGSEAMLSQKIDNLRWKISKFLPSQKKIELAATGSIKASCGSFFNSSNPVQRESFFYYTVQIQYSNNDNLDIFSQALTNPVLSNSSVGIFNDPSSMTFIRDSDYLFKLTNQQPKIAQPNDTVTYELQLVGSKDISKFKMCTGAIWSEGWKYTVSMPRIINSTSCKLLPGNKVMVSYKIPGKVIDIDLQLLGVGLISEQNMVMATVNRPILTQVHGNTLANQASLHVDFAQVEPLSEIGDYPIKSSFVTSANDTFTAKIEFKGSQSLIRQHYDALLFFDYHGELRSRLLSSVFSEADNTYITNVQTQQTSSGVMVQVTFKIPLKLNINVDTPANPLFNPPMYGFKFNAFAVLTDQLELVEAVFPDPYEAIVVSPRLFSH